MSISIMTETLRASLVSQKNAYKAIHGNFATARQNIRSYLDESNLEGRAFRANKAYFQGGHLPALSNLESTFNALISANDAHVSAVDNHLRPYGFYDSTIIETNLSWVRQSLFWLDATIAAVGSIISWATGLISLRAERREFQRAWQERGDRLNSYLNATTSLYNDMDTNFATLERLLLRLEIAGSCPTTGRMILPSWEDVALVELRKTDGLPNWDVIEDLVAEILGRIGQGITSEELALLAEIAVKMNAEGHVEGLENMLNAMAQPLGAFDVSGSDISPWRHWDLDDASLWQIPPNLIVALQHELRMLANEATGAERGEILQLHELFGLFGPNAMATNVLQPDTIQWGNITEEARHLGLPAPQLGFTFSGTADNAGIRLTSVTGSEEGMPNSLELSFHSFAHVQNWPQNTPISGSPQVTVQSTGATMQVVGMAMPSTFVVTGFMTSYNLQNQMNTLVTNQQMRAHDFDWSKHVVSSMNSFGAGEIIDLVVAEIPLPGLSTAVSVLDDLNPLDALRTNQATQKSIQEMSDAWRLATNMDRSSSGAVFITNGDQRSTNFDFTVFPIGNG